MSSALQLIVFGLVYFVTNSSSDFVYNGSIPFTNVSQRLLIPSGIKQVSQDPPAKRQDYTYTPGIGAHKVHSVAAKWYEARQICKQEGGNLVIINSAAEAELVVHLLEKSEKLIGATNVDFASIGFHDLFKEGNFETLNGQSLSEAGYNEWGSGEPNGGKKENCGTIARDGKFNDGDCDVLYGFVCELPGPSLDAPTSSVKIPQHPELVIKSDDVWSNTDNLPPNENYQIDNQVVTVK